MKRIVISIALIAITIACLAQKKYYVKPDGIPGINGISWDWASNDLQAVVNKASSGDIVYVAVGTYSGGFVMKEGVTVQGGYTANSNNPTERYNVLETDDPAKQSILDGGGTQRVLTQYAPFSVSTTWEGFVIQNGNPSVTFQTGSVIYSKEGINKIAGILYKYNAESGEGMMVGSEEIRKQWGGYEQELTELPIAPTAENAKNDVSGLSNSEKIVSVLDTHSIDFSREDYPSNGNYAAYWCDTLTTGGYVDWYLPSSGELQEVYEANVLLLMKSIGKDVFNGYWTSSHVGNTLAWAYYFGKGHCHPALKYVQHTVAAVHPFVFSGTPDGIYVAGGGVFLGSNGILENCIVKNNTSTYRGGGVYVGGGGQLINCIVEGNEAPEGKEIYYEWPLGIHSAGTGNNAVRVYPNPVKAGETISVDWKSTGLVNYQLLDASGSIVKRGTWQAEENELTAPAQKGIYILLLHSENKNYKSKIIIQ
jgi:hypothetical protein